MDTLPEPVTVSLDHDAALVLFDVLASGRVDVHALSLAERKALTLLLGALETQLAGPLTEHYKQHLAVASLGVISRYGALKAEP
jgi:hypothetical protein